MERTENMEKTPPQLDGYFHTRRQELAFIKIEGGRVTYHEAGRDVFDRMSVEFGHFHAAPLVMSQAAGKLNFNLKLVVYFDEKNPERKVQRYGIVSDDFCQMFFMDDANTDEVNVSHRITKVAKRQQTVSNIELSIMRSEQPRSC